MLNVCLINVASAEIELLRRICPFEVSLLSAQDVQTACSLIRHNQIGAFVIDLELTNAQLLELIGHINSHNGCCPIYAYTAKSNPRTALMAGQLGFSAYYKRPQERQKLAFAIAKLLKSGPHAPPQTISAFKSYNCPRSIRLAMDYALENFANMRHAQELHTVLGMSYGHFCTKFKYWTGYTFWDYVILLKIEEAKRLLEETPFRVKEISSRVGFNDYSHFLKIFKLHEGVTPKNYRKRMRNEMFAHVP